ELRPPVRTAARVRHPRSSPRRRPQPRPRQLRPKAETARMPAPERPSLMARRSLLVPSGPARARTSTVRLRLRTNQRQTRRRFAPSKCHIDAPKRNGIRLNHHFALACCLSMIFSENRFPLFRIMRCKLLLRRDRYFDWRAIAAALHQAVLLSLQVTDGVGDPNAETHQRYQDRKRNQIHDHPVAIIDRLVLFVFEPREIVEIIFDRLWQGGRKRRLNRPARLKFQYLADWSGVTRIGSLDNRL